MSTTDLTPPTYEPERVERIEMPSKKTKKNPISPEDKRTMVDMYEEALRFDHAPMYAVMVVKEKIQAKWGDAGVNFMIRYLDGKESV